MKKLAAIAIVLVMASTMSATSQAADLVRIPIGVVPGSVTVKPTGVSSPSGTEIPIVLPYSDFIDATIGQSGCDDASGTVSLSIVDGALEAEISGVADSTGSGRCAFEPAFQLDLELSVPDFDEGSTLVILRPVEVEPGLNSPGDEHSIRWLDTDSESTALATENVIFYELSAGYSSVLFPGGNPRSVARTADQAAMIPGDLVRTRVFISTRLLDSGSNVADGSLRVRFEFVAVRRTSLPEPGAGLSLPIGTLGLMGLASLRG